MQVVGCVRNQGQETNAAGVHDALDNNGLTPRHHPAKSGSIEEAQRLLHGGPSALRRSAGVMLAEELGRARAGAEGLAMAALLRTRRERGQGGAGAASVDGYRSRGAQWRAAAGLLILLSANRTDTYAHPCDGCAHSHIHPHRLQ